MFVRRVVLLLRSLAVAGILASLAARAQALPNVRVEMITPRYTCGADGMCSTVFDLKVCNRGTTASAAMSVGMRGWGTSTINTCTGAWRAVVTTPSLAAGACRSVTINGPGFVGPKLKRGTLLAVVASADVRCLVKETNEGDNLMTLALKVGTVLPPPPPNLPDLRVEGVSATARTCDAHGLCAVEIRCTVCNRGTARPGNYVVGVRGWGTPRIATSCTGAWTSGATETGTNPGTCQSFTLEGPGFWGPGVGVGTTLSLTVAADIQCQVKELNEANNTFVRAVTVGSATPPPPPPPPPPPSTLPNLQVESIQASSNCVGGQCAVQFTCNVCNRGTTLARSAVVGMKGWGTPSISGCKDTWTASNTTADIGPGGCQLVTIAGPGNVGPKLPGGTGLNVTAGADIHCAITESSETDNTLSKTFTIGSAQTQPDLVVQSITPHTSCGSTGQCTVTFTCRVCNQGTVAAQGFVVAMKGWGTPNIGSCTGTWAAFNTVAGLAPGACTDVLVNGPGLVGPQLPKGASLSVTAIADMNCSIAEGDEGNNQASRTISVIP